MGDGDGGEVHSLPRHGLDSSCRGRGGGRVRGGGGVYGEWLRVLVQFVELELRGFGSLEVGRVWEVGGLEGAVAVAAVSVGSWGL